MFVFLVRSFIKNSLDHLKGGEVSRVSIARGVGVLRLIVPRPSRGARCLNYSNVQGLLSKEERISWLFRHLGGGRPPGSPRGGIDYDGS